MWKGSGSSSSPTATWSAIRWCRKSCGRTKRQRRRSERRPPAVHGDTMLALMLAAAMAANASGIEFVEDDYPAALAQARKEHKPVLVDTWASWCHTCLSMKRFVFPDAGLRPVKDAVVWLSIDSENPKNNAFLDRFPLDAWPTFLVIEPRAERVVGRWIGAASVNDFRTFVQEGVRSGESKPKADAATAQLHAGYEARARRDFDSAAAAYRKALDLTKKDDPA